MESSIPQPVHATLSPAHLYNIQATAAAQETKEGFYKAV